MKTKLILFFSFLLFFYNCGEAPEKGEILYLDVAKNKISYKIVDLPNIVDITKLQSTYFNFLAGGEISIYVRGTIDESTTIDDLNKMMYTKKGHTPGFRYNIQDDAIIPYTLKDSILLTLYYNMNSAMSFFVNLGLPINKGANNDSWGTMDVFFELEAKINPDNHDSMRDNAFYYPFMQIMAFLEQKQLKFLAMAANPMVVTHEFAHSIFDFYANGRMKGSELLSKYDPPTGDSEADKIKICKYNKDTFYKSAMNEGFSDYWGSIHVGRSDMILLSINKHQLGVDVSSDNGRDLENNRNLKKSMLIDSSCNPIQGRQYQGGTIWASSLWEINKLNISPKFNEYVLESYKCLHEYFASKKDITLLTPGNCLIKTLKSKGVNTDKACSVLNRRFAILGGLNECN